MTPLLCRTNERATRSVFKILLTAILFFVGTRIVSMVAIGVVSLVYMQLQGINPMEALHFFGDPNQIAAGGVTTKAILSLLIVAPLWEELAFRLALSFRRRDAIIGCGAMTLFLVSQVLRLMGVNHTMEWALVAAMVVVALVWRFTDENFWASKRQRWLVPSMIASAVLFGLAHLMAMTGLTLELLPFALLICMMLFFAGATFTYLRVNLGFGWALGAHIVNNIPPVLMLVAQMQ